MDGFFSLFATFNALSAAAVAGLAFGGTAIAAAVLVLRDHLRVEAHAGRLEADVARLARELEEEQDARWQEAETAGFFRSLVESQIDAIVQTDAQGRITYANDGYARLLGRSREALIGRVLGPQVVETRPARIGPDGTRRVDEAIETPDGLRWLGWIETQVPVREGPPERLRAGREITERIDAQTALDDARSRAEAASEAKSRFLATVSHEFRTPLNGILGMADLLLDTPLDAEQKTYARAVKTSGAALLSLIDEILDFSKIEAGKLALAADPFEIAAIVEGVVELLAPRAQGKGIEIASFVAPCVPPRLVGDAERLRQILVNLAGNAVKFTEAGGIGIAVRRSETGEIEIAVADTGPGIVAERIPALFEEFEQGDGSAARRHGGTGLGLAITQRLVSGMGGTIAVESALGQGTTFRVRLPLPAAAAAIDPTDGADAPATARPLAGRRYLVLARSPFEAPFLAERLALAGAEAVLVDNEVEALARIATAPAADRGAFEALIVDCALGDDVARDVALAAREAGIGRALVLVSPFERRDLGPPNAAGFDDYLVKPLRTRSLLARLVEPDAAPSEPLAAAAPQAHLRRLPGERANAPRAGAPRVLLAEDNEINALLALKTLEKRGAIVDWAKDGHEAVSLAEASFSGLRPDYDVVLMDIRMPGLDGLEATRRIRTLERALGRRVPRRIVALTANVLKEDEEAARAAGLDGFLPKPFEPRHLDALVGALPPVAARNSGSVEVARAS